MKMIQSEDLSTSDFIIDKNKVHILSVTKQYMLTLPTENVGSDTNLNNRRCSVNQITGQGTLYLKLTMKADTSGIETILSLPSDCPVPLFRTEWRSEDGGIVYLNSGRRAIFAQNLKKGKTYVVSITTDFKVQH